MKGIDISNWNGALTPDFVACLKANDIEHVVVRASLETSDKGALTRQQLRALTDAGIQTSVYLWMYTSWSPEQTVRDTLTLIEGFSVTHLWLDCEDPNDVGTPAENVAWIRSAVAAIRSAGFAPGIYTAAWWWKPHTDDSAAFAEVPLWVADYDGVPDLDVWHRFGGWHTALAKQYQGGSGPTLCGAHLDLDVFDDSLRTTPETQPPEQRPGWPEVPGGGRTVDAPAAVLFEDRIWVFVRAFDGSVWASSRGYEPNWPGWEPIGPPGTLASAPTAVVKGGSLYLFGRGPDDSIRTLSRREHEPWS